MTTWTTFETIDEREYETEFYIDRLGMHSYRQDERTRFVRNRQSNGLWNVGDLEVTADDDSDLSETTIGTMRECVQFIAGRVLYGA